MPALTEPLPRWEWELLQTDLDCDCEGCRDYYWEEYLCAFNATSQTTTETTEVNAVPATITYGIEIECYVPRSIGQQGVADALRALGINAVSASYSGRDYRVWQVKTDGSLNSAPSGYTGIEVVSPILTYDYEGHEDMIVKVSEYLTSIDAKVNRSCGGHVHLSVGHLDANGLASLVELYYLSKAAIGPMIAPSRRDGTYYASYAPADRMAVVCGDIRNTGTSQAYRIGGHNSVINADWYAQRGTLEFRQREASINHYKIRGWVGFLVGLIRAAEDSVALNYDSNDGLMEAMIAADYITPVLADWVNKRRLPRITVARIQEARATAQARVSRLMSLQGVR